MAGLLYRLGRFSARHRWAVILTWVIVLALAGTATGLFAGTISTAISIPGTATTRVTDELAAKLPKTSGGTGSLVFETSSGARFTAAQREKIGDLLDSVADKRGVRGVQNPFTTERDRTQRLQDIADGRTKIADARKTLATAQDRLDDGSRQLDTAQRQLDQAIARAKSAGSYPQAAAQLDTQQQQIDAQRSTLKKNQATLDDNRSTVNERAHDLTVGAQLLTLAQNIRSVSTDGNTATATVAFRQATTAVPAQLKTAIAAEATGAGISGVHVYVSNDIAQTIGSVVGPGEIAGLVIAAVVLLIMLGTAIGAALPLLSAVLGVGVAAAGALAFSGIVQFTSVTPVLAVMLGLAVGIDYSLFILNRHRRQLKLGMGLHESIGLANGTSGNAVVFAGMTVIIALLALNVSGIPFLGLMGDVGAAAVAVAILVAVSFTPAVLSLVGMRILSRRERAATAAPEREDRTKPMSTVRAVITLVVGVAALVVVALPATQMRLGLPTGASEAEDSTQYKAYSLTAEKFGPGANGALLVVATLQHAPAKSDLPETELTIGRALARQHDVDAVAPIGASRDRTVVAFQVVPEQGPSSVSTQNLVTALRDASPLRLDGQQVRLGVAGNASANIDISSKVADALPLYVLVVVGLSFLILILVFRSLLVPLTATLGFVLSLIAAFGGITAIYQNGFLSGVFGVHDPGPVLSFLPIVEVGILFGLAMDYQLFLVSGMREAFAHGAPARLAVQRGFHAGRSVVIAAAIIMISVFGGFVFADSSSIRPIGFGLAFGVLVDAFVVRLLLIPAVMHVLGRAAWWFPKWLDRLLPDVDVEGARLERAHPAHPDTPAGHPTATARREAEASQR
ncbi:MMPL family transporter [Jatrophihabitans endophyticus]|uniref:MMPL family transporter n=1 Tax=Jatrophihabitans endophyticus TaxID=1206085 RepID=UPI001A09AB0E|nr:MMPL family transporter [Jatrophihabitans endophyticus]MBE7189622.1 MMPL family transporter [Jatrophihabitans endophyticus]